MFLGILGLYSLGSKGLRVRDLTFWDPQVWSLSSGDLGSLITGDLKILGFVPGHLSPSGVFVLDAGSLGVLKVLECVPGLLGLFWFVPYFLGVHLWM